MLEFLEHQRSGTDEYTDSASSMKRELYAEPRYFTSANQDRRPNLITSLSENPRREVL
jgi:hypothetical protein